MDDGCLGEPRDKVCGWFWRRELRLRERGLKKDEMWMGNASGVVLKGATWGFDAA